MGKSNPTRPSQFYGGISRNLVDFHCLLKNIKTLIHLNGFKSTEKKEPSLDRCYLEVLWVESFQRSMVAEGNFKLPDRIGFLRSVKIEMPIKIDFLRGIVGDGGLSNTLIHLELTCLKSQIEETIQS